jgi:hypothetical protein
MPFNPQCLATRIGSFPHKDVERTCELILETIPELPIWPQLPNANFLEQMEAQYSEAFPNVVIDDSNEKMHFNTGEESTAALEGFYESVMEEHLDHFKISAEFSRGIHAMEKRLRANRPSSVQFFKSQVTGPLTFGLATVDEKKRALYYNEVYRDLVIKGIAMKARWLLDKFKRLKERIKYLASKGIDENLIWEKCLLTPSCGTGSLPVELSENVFYTLAEVSRILREWTFRGSQHHNVKISEIS